MIVVALLFAWKIFQDNVQPETISIATPPVTLPVGDNVIKTAPVAVQTPPRPEKVPLSAAPRLTERPAKLILHSVPFTAQAPTAEWEDERQQDGCEEVSALMAIRWIQGKGIEANEARREIIAISDYEQSQYGEYRDINIADVASWIFDGYYNYNKTLVRHDVTVDDLIAELYTGRVILAPMHGQKLHNPYFSGKGPERHMLLIRGYDPRTDEFITNDPGTKRGEAYRYKSATIIDALLAYPTGYHEVITKDSKGIVVVSK